MKVYTRSTVAITVLAMCLALAGTAAAKGKKYGLFVGINNYPAPTNTLYGAVNDAKNMKSLLETKFGFTAANDAILTDQQATRAAILSNLASLGAKAGAGDLLVFQYSGHGTLFPDKYSDEVDETQKTELHVVFEDGSKLDIPSNYYDSAICPWDLDSESSGKNWGNLILDDELYAAFAPLTAKGVQVVFIADSCHSGSVAKAGKLAGQVRFANPFAIRKVSSFDDLRCPLRPVKRRSEHVSFREITWPSQRLRTTSLQWTRPVQRSRADSSQQRSLTPSTRTKRR